MQVTLELPEEFSLDGSPEEWSQRIKLYTALMMYQSGEFSAGAACEFAGVDRYTFIEECGRLKIPMIYYDEGELEAELRSINR